MELFFGIVNGVIALVGTMLTLLLIFAGLRAFGNFLFPFMRNPEEEPPGSLAEFFSIWGMAHTALFGFMLKFASGYTAAAMARFQTAYLEPEGLLIILAHSVLPLVASFAFARLYRFIQDKRRKAT
jgi:hypothetical protein